MTVCLFNIQYSSGLVINIHVRVSTYCYDVYTHESNLTCDLISTLIQEMDIYFACSVIVNNCPVVSLISSEYVYLAWSARDYSIHVIQLVAYACQWACLRHQSNLGLSCLTLGVTSHIHVLRHGMYVWHHTWLTASTLSVFLRDIPEVLPSSRRWT